MKASKLRISVVSLFILLIMVLVIGCSQQDSMVGFTDKQNVSSEASTESYYEDIDNLASTASLASDAQLGGRVAGLDDRFCDNVKVTFWHKSTNNPDTITIDFGLDAGCTDPRGNLRKGKIMIVFSPGSRFQIGSSITTTFDNFSVNGVMIEGTRTVQLSERVENEYVVHEITLDNGKITWPDNTSATRSAHHFRKIDMNATPLILNDDRILILKGGTALGINRNSKEYDMQITDDIVFETSCLLTKKYMPVSGTKVLMIDGKTVTINYGAGDCDNAVTITINGESKVVTIVRE